MNHNFFEPPLPRDYEIFVKEKVRMKRFLDFKRKAEGFESEPLTVTNISMSNYVFC